MAHVIHIPKGSMCMGCKRFMDDCSHFEFDKMRKIQNTFRKDGTMLISVRCPEFIRKEK